ncbi:MAG: metallophosphoesterase family protein [Deltaproteobacteria bacterium]|nr:metallophosphoesterase family protein [Deltaproteobacteria bacterium]
MATPLASRPMGFLSDVHGNIEALDAVLEELRKMGVADIYVAGDHLLGGDAPLEVWRRLVDLGAVCTRGPGDVALATMDPDKLEALNDDARERLARFVSTRDAVGELVLSQLKKLPDAIRLPMVDGRELVMTHGSPADPHTEISHDMTETEVTALVHGDPADLFICGATHVPFDRTIDDIRVVNVGSVGESPEGRVAHFTVVTPELEAAEVLQTWVEY